MGQAANASRDAITKESYVGEVLPYDEWDKDKNFGCSCERAAYTGPYHDSRGDYFGPDCKRSTCPAGADPERTEVAVDADGNRLVPYPPTLPVPFVSRGCTDSQQVIEGTLQTIAERIGDVDLPTPALAVIGEVVRLRATLAWHETDLSTLLDAASG